MLSEHGSYRSGPAAKLNHQLPTKIYDSRQPRDDIFVRCRATTFDMLAQFSLPLLRCHIFVTAPGIKCPANNFADLFCLVRRHNFHCFFLHLARFFIRRLTQVVRVMSAFHQITTFLGDLPPDEPRVTMPRMWSALETVFCTIVFAGLGWVFGKNALDGLRTGTVYAKSTRYERQSRPILFWTAWSLSSVFALGCFAMVGVTIWGFAVFN